MKEKSKKIVIALLISSLIFGGGILFYSIIGLFETHYISIYMLLMSLSIFYLLGTAFSFFYLRNDESLEAYSYAKMDGRYIKKYLQISFFVVLILISYVLSKSLYTKPLEYYLLVAIGTVLVAIQIALLDKKSKKEFFFIFFLEIIPLSLITLGSSLLINPYLVGPDTPWHFNQVQKILETYHLSRSSFHYYYYPLYHLTQTIGQLVLASSQFSFDIINLTTSMTAVLLAYLLGKELFNDKKAGLYSSLLISVSTNLIFLMANTSKIGGTTLFLICFWTLIKMKRSQNIKWLYLFWLAAVGVFFWHTEASVALLLLITAFAITDMVTNNEKRSWIDRGRQSRNMLILYSVAFIGYLVYVHVYLFTSILESIFIPMEPTLTQDFADIDLSSNSLIEFFISFLGMSSLLFFLPFLMSRSILFKDKGELAMTFFLVLVCILPLIAIVREGFGLAPERTLTYFMIAVTIFSGGGLTILMVKSQKSRRTFNKNVKLFLLAIFIFIYSLSSTTSYLSWDNNDLFSNDIPEQTVFTTESNLASHWFLNMTPENSRIIGYHETIRYTTDPVRGFIGLQGREIIKFPNFKEGSFFVIEWSSLDRLNWEDTNWGQEILSILPQGDRVFCNGAISIYYV